jgi:hypothetical protein
MWWWIYIYHIRDCNHTFSNEGDLQARYDPRGLLPLTFAWSDPTPLLSPKFDAWRDSIVGSLKSDQLLHVTALVYRDESPGGDITELSARRARAISRLFEHRLEQERIVADAELGQITADIRNKTFPAYRLGILTQNDNFYETGLCTLVRFPYDSAHQVQASAIDPYIRSIVDLNASKSTILELQTFEKQLNRKTEDMQGSKLRLQALRQTFISYGIPAERIILAAGEDRVPYHCLPQQWDVAFSDWIVIRYLN